MGPIKRTRAGLIDHRASVARNEHLSNLYRVKRLAVIGLITWPLFGLGDWFITEFVHAGRLSVYLGLRAIGFAIIVPAFVRVFSKPTPSEQLLRVLDTAASAALASLVTLAMVEFDGISSPLVLGVMTIMFARGAIITDRWQRGLLPNLIIVATYPLTLLAMSTFSDTIATQFRDSQTLGMFGLNMLFLLTAVGIAVLGGHMVWSLRRQVLEAKSVGRYELVKRIGRGGMGEVWLAKHATLKLDVAIKILAPEKKQVDDLAIARFEREVKATCELTHPNTIRVFDYGVTEDGLFYYAMELLKGEDLAEIVRKEGPLEASRAARLIWQASRALAEAHSRGIVHRDLKPENLFVTTTGGEPDHVKVLDFGLVQLNDSDVELTRAGWAVGTPTYIAPEVVLGEKADARSDVYALGTVLYFLLTGQTPFGSRELRRLLAANVREAPKRPSEKLGRGVPHGLENIVLACLEKDPSKRYDSAYELAQALEAFLTAAVYDEPRVAIRNKASTSHIFVCNPKLAGERSGEYWGDATQVDVTPPGFTAEK